MPRAAQKIVLRHAGSQIKRAIEMMTPENNIWQLAEAYFHKNISATELKALEERVASDKNFASEFEEALNILRSLKQNGEQNRFIQTLEATKQKIKTEIANQPRKISLRVHYLRTAAVAAGVAIIATVSTNIWDNKQQDSKSKYSELRKVRSEIEGIKKSQNLIIKNLNNKANKPAIENKYSGTGFALSNDGYLVTNYHVTEGADSLYIQTRDGNYYKAFTVSFDAETDIAILKIEAKKFKFAKQNALPYTFANKKALLGEQVFTLGYPQDEIVYSEGYISSKNGYLGDSMQYRLELPAEPGQSGAPVIDASGNILGIVTGKETKSVGTTYAVCSKTLLKLLSSVPNNISLPKTNTLSKLSRAQQIEKIQDYTCVVHVYK